MTDTRSTPIPYPARAVAGGVVVAESRSAIRVDIADGAPELWFPLSDTTGLDAAAGRWRAGTGALADRVAFDHDEVRVEIVDGDDEVDPTVTRFPNWGDAADLVDVVDVRPVDGRRFVSEARADWRRPVVEGSQILGQTIVAACRLTTGRRPVSASMIFARGADARIPYDLDLEQVSSGRTFTAFRAEAVQGERTCAFGSVLLDVTATDVIRHAEPPPDVPGPRDSTPYDMGVTGRDLRIVDDAYTGDPDAPVGPPELDAWVRFRQVPDDQAIHAGLLAQFTGHLSIAAALRPHAGVGQDEAHRTLSTAINAIALSIHADVRADRWMLYHHRSTVASDGMTHAECRVHDEDGALVASFTVDAMVRAMTLSTGDVDHRSAM